MKIRNLVIALLVALTIISCSSSNRNEEVVKDSSDKVSSAQESPSVGEFNSNRSVASSSAAVENKKDTTHKFIRTADLKFKVKSVIQSTYNIEDVTTKNGGFVTYTNLTSAIDNVTTTIVSKDSTLETTYYTVNNTITLRVPNVMLDTTLKEIAKNIDFLDYRLIKAEDVALQIFTNDLTKRRLAKNQDRISKAIDNKAKKLNETYNAEESLLNKQEQADNVLISNMALKEQIQYSTVNLIIYQRQSISRELIANDNNIDEYEPGFGTKMLDSLKVGWKILEAIFVFFAKLWGVLFLIAIAYIFYRKFRKIE